MHMPLLLLTYVNVSYTRQHRSLSESRLYFQEWVTQLFTVGEKLFSCNDRFISLSLSHVSKRSPINWFRHHTYFIQGSIRNPKPKPF